LGRIDQSTGRIFLLNNTNLDSNSSTISEFESRISRSLIVGPSLVIDKIVSDLKLDWLVKVAAGPDKWQHILSLVYFVAMQKEILPECEYWSEHYHHPLNSIMTTKQTIEFVASVDRKMRNEFLQAWNELFLGERNCYCFFITLKQKSASMENFEEAAINDVRSHINLAITYGIENYLPLRFDILPQIPHNPSLNKILETVLFNKSQMTYILDDRFYNNNCYEDLCKSGYKFILQINNLDDYLTSIVQKHKISLTNVAYQHQIENELIFMNSFKHNWNEIKCHLHIYNNESEKALESYEFKMKLEKIKIAIEKGNASQEIIDKYSNYLTIRETPKNRKKKVSLKKKAIEKRNPGMVGFSCILTNTKLNAIDALNICRDRTFMQTHFANFQKKKTIDAQINNLNTPLESKLVIYFLALIILNKIRNVKRSDVNLKNLSEENLLSALEPIMQFEFTNDFGSAITEIDSKQERILSAFDVKIPL
jgi:hypothetical protein